MTARPEISVLINNYNYARFLPAAIESALDQQDVDAEVIVVDDGSTDGSAEVIESYGARVRALFQRNSGQAAALNSGVSMARAPLLAFLDADDWWAPRKLRAVIDAFADEPDAGLVYHRLQPVWNDGSPAFRPVPRSLCAGDIAPRLLRSGGRWPYPMTSSLSLRRTVWDRAGEIPRSFRISADAWITGVLPFLAPVAALPRPLGFYRIHDNGWYRSHDDDAMLARRVAHWEETARVTNRFLALNGRTERVDAHDHFDRAVAIARLGQPGAPGRLELFLRGVTDAGEPNLLRRLRAATRALGARREARRDPARSLR